MGREGSIFRALAARVIAVWSVAARSGHDYHEGCAAHGYCLLGCRYEGRRRIAKIAHLLVRAQSPARSLPVDPQPEPPLGSFQPDQAQSRGLNLTKLEV